MTGSVAIADTIEDLTPEWFTGALREGGTIAEGGSVTSAESEFIGTGQLGSVVLSKLAYEGAPDAPPSLVVKLPSRDETARQMGVALRVYEAEVRFYEEISPMVEVAVPAMHWGGIEPETGRFTLVLDDLSRTAAVGDAIAGGTVEQLELAMRFLAELQTPLWDSSELRRHEWLSDLARTEMLFGAVPGALEPFAERFGSLIEPEHLKLARELAPKAAGVVTKLWGHPFVISHGDYRVDNMMFGTAPGSAPLAVIDWQGTRMGLPALDIAYCLAASMSTEDRRTHERDLIRSYHKALPASATADFSLDDCWESYRVGSLYPFLALLPASLTLEQTERGDQMLAGLIGNAADLVADTGVSDLLA